MKGKIKMIGMDLDGTLLTSQKELTAYTRDVLRRAVEQGIVALPATGRPLSGIPGVDQAGLEFTEIHLPLPPE